MGYSFLKKEKENRDYSLVQKKKNKLYNKKLSYTRATHLLILDLEVFISGILISIYLHVGHVTFFLGYSLIDFNKSLWTDTKRKIPLVKQSYSYDMWLVNQMITLPGFVAIWHFFCG